MKGGGGFSFFDTMGVFKSEYSLVAVQVIIEQPGNFVSSGQYLFDIENEYQRGYG